MIAMVIILTPPHLNEISQLLSYLLSKAPTSSHGEVERDSGITQQDSNQDIEQTSNEVTD